MNYEDTSPIIPMPGEPDEIDARTELFNMYGNHIVESHEDFCDRMADKYGDNWIYILTRKA